MFKEKSKVCMKCAPTGMVAEVAAIEIAGTYFSARAYSSARVANSPVTAGSGCTAEFLTLLHGHLQWTPCNLKVCSAQSVHVHILLSTAIMI